MSALRALAYADWRALVNDARTILRSPARLVIWAIYVLWIASLVMGRIVGQGRVMSDSGMVDLYADGCASLLVLSVAYAFGFGGGTPGLFASRVEALRIIGSPLSPQVAIAYLALRGIVGNATRVLIPIVAVIAFLARRRLSAWDLGLDALVIFSFTAAAIAVAVPRRLLRGTPARVCASVGVGCIIVDLEPLMRVSLTSLGAGDARFAALARLLPAWHPGVLLLAPTVMPVAICAGICAAAVVTLVEIARDAYPELYAMSAMKFALQSTDGTVRERIQARRTIHAQQRANSVRERPARSVRALQTARAIPAGALAISWKSVWGTLRFVSRARVITIVAGAVAFGAFLAYVLRHGPHGSGAIVLGICAQLLLVSALVGSIVPTGELRSPLFRLGGAGSFERLCALALGMTWLRLVLVGCIALGSALGGADVFLVVLGAALIGSFLLAITCTGIVSAILFPAASDSRGPLPLVRFVAFMTLLATAGVGYGLASIVVGPIVGLNGAIVVLLTEAALVLAIGTALLEGRFDRMRA